MLIFMSNELCFFFEQKTAYEMRISDWSSDVCSSDLLGIGLRALEAQLEGVEAALRQPAVEGAGVEAPGHHRVGDRLLLRRVLRGGEAEGGVAVPGEQLGHRVHHHVGAVLEGDRKSTRLNSSH